MFISAAFPTATYGLNVHTDDLFDIEMEKLFYRVERRLEKSWCGLCKCTLTRIFFAKIEILWPAWVFPPKNKRVITMLHEN